MPVPANPKIYHIVHVDRLPSIVADGFIRSDAESGRRGAPGTTIGIDEIKRRRLNELTLGNSHPDLHVGECAPFYFCPRSVMLYVIHRANHRELTYQGGQEPVVHLQTDLRQAVAWANAERRRWAFTTSSAASYHFEDYCDLAHLDKVDWNADYAAYGSFLVAARHEHRDTQNWSPFGSPRRALSQNAPLSANGCTRPIHMRHREVQESVPLACSARYSIGLNQPSRLTRDSALSYTSYFCSARFSGPVANSPP